MKMQLRGYHPDPFTRSVLKSPSIQKANPTDAAAQLESLGIFPGQGLYQKLPAKGLEAWQKLTNTAVAGAILGTTFFAALPRKANAQSLPPSHTVYLPMVAHGTGAPLAGGAEASAVTLGHQLYLPMVSRPVAPRYPNAQEAATLDQITSVRNLSIFDTGELAAKEHELRKQIEGMETFLKDPFSKDPDQNVLGIRASQITTITTAYQEHWWQDTKVFPENRQAHESPNQVRARIQSQHGTLLDHLDSLPDALLGTTDTQTRNQIARQFAATTSHILETSGDPAQVERAIDDFGRIQAKMNPPNSLQAILNQGEWEHLSDLVNARSLALALAGGQSPTDAVDGWWARWGDTLASTGTNLETFGLVKEAARVQQRGDFTAVLTRLKEQKYLPAISAVTSALALASWVNNPQLTEAQKIEATRDGLLAAGDGLSSGGASLVIRSLAQILDFDATRAITRSTAIGTLLSVLGDGLNAAIELRGNNTNWLGVTGDIAGIVAALGGLIAQKLPTAMMPALWTIQGVLLGLSVVQGFSEQIQDHNFYDNANRERLRRTMRGLDGVEPSLEDQTPGTFNYWWTQGYQRNPPVTNDFTLRNVGNLVFRAHGDQNNDGILELIRPTQPQPNQQWQWDYVMLENNWALFGVDTAQAAQHAPLPALAGDPTP